MLPALAFFKAGMELLCAETEMMCCLKPMISPRKLAQERQTRRLLNQGEMVKSNAQPGGLDHL